MSSPFQRVVAIIVLWIVWAFVVMSRYLLSAGLNVGCIWESILWPKWLWVYALVWGMEEFGTGWTGCSSEDTTRPLQSFLFSGGWSLRS